MLTPRRSVWLPVAALTIVAAALRLFYLGHQALWFDESYTLMLVKLPFGKMLSTIPRTESTPYLYYVLAWAWTHLFGRGAADLRSLSALLGTAFVPVAFVATAKLLDRHRPALIVAALATFSPLLIWYSQEARAYELLALTSAATLLAFAYARERPTGKHLSVWALLCAVALVTHYDAALVVIPEAVWLLAMNRHSRRAWAATAFVAVCGAALIPVLVSQSNSGNTSWIQKAPLNSRLGQILPQFLLGTGSYAYKPLMYVAFALGLTGLVLLARMASSTERAAALPLGAIAVGGFVMMMLVLAAGSDTVLTRNMLPLWLPLAMVLAAGFGAAVVPWRVGLALTFGLCALGLTATISIATDRTLQKPDWPAVVRALGPWTAPQHPARTQRLLLFQRNPWLKSLTVAYMPNTHRFRHQHARRVTEIDVIVNSSPPSAEDHWLCWWGAGCNLYASRLQKAYPVPGFHVLSRTRVNQFTILRMVRNKPHIVSRAQINEALTSTQLYQDGLLIQHSAAG